MGASGSKKETSTSRFDNVDPNSTRLDLQSKGITDLPSDINIGLLKQLKWLSLQNNSLTTLPDAIGQCIALQTLRLRGNKISKFPDTMSQLVNLQNIDASRNALTTFPTVLCMSQILELNLQFNLIETVCCYEPFLDCKQSNLNPFLDPTRAIEDVECKTAKLVFQPY